MEPTKLDPTVETALRTMHDIVVPSPVSWFPQTWAWVVLLMILVFLLFAWSVFAARRYRRNAYRRQALRELETEAQFARNVSKRDSALRALASLLKRTALATWPRDRVASLSGLAFVGFLKGSAKDLPLDGLTELLDDAEYRDVPSGMTSSPEECDRIFDEARVWIERHHVPT